MSEESTAPPTPSFPSPEAVRLAPILESVLFASPEPLPLVALRKILGEETPVGALIEALVTKSKTISVGTSDMLNNAS